MEIKMNFVHMEHTEALDQRIREKSQKIAKFFNGRTEIHWTCYVKEGVHYAEVKLLGPRFEYHAKSGEETLYKSFDKVIQKIQRQLVKKKTRMRGKVHGTNVIKLVDLQRRESDEEYEIQKTYDEVA